MTQGGLQIAEAIRSTGVDGTNVRLEELAASGGVAQVSKR